MSGLLEQTEWEGGIYSGGFIEGSGGRLEVSDKAPDEVLSVVGAASRGDVRRAVDVARDAQPDWALTPGKERAGVLRRAAALLGERAEEVTNWIVRETGSIGPKGGWGLEYAIERLHATAALCIQPYGELVAPAERGQTSIAQRLPVGVVGQITPWNAPLALALRALAPALALGNAVVLKPDPQTPICGGLLLATILEQAGLPEGVGHVVPRAAETGEGLPNDPPVRRG